MHSQLRPHPRDPGGTIVPFALAFPFAVATAHARKNGGKMRDKRPRFQRKWQAILYECLRLSRPWWTPFSKKEGWRRANKHYLKQHDIRTYNAWERCIRRLSDWSFLYCYSGQAFIPHRYIVSISGINKLESLGAIDKKEAAGLKRRVALEHG